MPKLSSTISRRPTRRGQSHTRVRGWREMALTVIRPEGWLRAFLERQRDGLTGHLEVAGYPFNTRGWKEDALPLGERGGSGWWPYEQYAYWLGFRWASGKGSNALRACRR